MLNLHIPPNLWGTRRLQKFWNWLRCWGLLCSVAKCPAGYQSATVQPGPCWATLLQVFLVSAQGLAQITLSKPLKGTQQAGEMGKQESQRWTKKSAKSYTGGITLSASTDWGLSSCRAALQRTAVSHEPPWVPAAKKPHRSALKEHCQQAEGGDSFLCSVLLRHNWSAGSSFGLPSPTQKWAHKSESR